LENFKNVKTKIASLNRPFVTPKKVTLQRFYKMHFLSSSDFYKRLGYGLFIS